MMLNPADIERVWKIVEKHVPEVTSGTIKCRIVREAGNVRFRSSFQ